MTKINKKQPRQPPANPTVKTEVFKGKGVEIRFSPLRESTAALRNALQPIVTLIGLVSNKIPVPNKLIDLAQASIPEILDLIKEIEQSERTSK